MAPGTIQIHVGDLLAGKYRVERIIGVGGMGMVVAASHLDLGELRAIKFLLPALASNTEAVERFTREARAAARLTSEHVVRVYDVGRFDDGVPYLVMEYLAGEDLGAQLAQFGQLPVELAVGYAMQTLEALAEAHEAGIVHRDLKPQNLLVTTTSQGQPCIKVLDFGISKVQWKGPDESTGLTGTEVAMGSPIYMSPEQMRSARRVDGRADLWSVGVIVYELLTGREPFSGDTLPALYQQILQADPRPPSQLNPKVPRELDAVILRALAKDREQRYATAYQLASALAPFGGAEGRRMRARVGAWTPNAASVPPPPMDSFEDVNDQQPTVVASRRADSPGGARGRSTDARPWSPSIPPRASTPPGAPAAGATPPPPGLTPPSDAHAWPTAPKPRRGASLGAQLVVLAVLVLALIGAVIIAAIVLFAEAPTRPAPTRSTGAGPSPSARDAGQPAPLPAATTKPP